MREKGLWSHHTEHQLGAALGASRARIVTLHVAESVALAMAGGLLGVVAANTAVRFFAAATSDILDAFWVDFRVDWAVLVFATVTVAVAGIVAGLLPDCARRRRTWRRC